MLDFAVIKVKPADTTERRLSARPEFPRLVAFHVQNCVPSANVCVGDPLAQHKAQNGAKRF